MKILCFIDSLGTGGAQRQMVEVAKGFKEKGHEVSFLTYHNINFFKPELDKHSIPVKTIEESNYIKRFFKIRRTIRESAPDTLLSFLSSANFMATLAGFPRKKWKLIVGERSANPLITRSFKHRFYRLFHLFPNYIVANSYANIKIIEKVNPLIPKNKIKIIYNIVNSNFDELPKQTIINKQITNIVIAASYRSVKNTDGLIEAIKLLPKTYKEKLKVNWYGNIHEDRAYYNQMIDLISYYGLENFIKLHDQTNDIFNKYLMADFVGLFSHHEGFPNTICEAMIMRKPVIVSKVSDIPLFISENQNGFLCNSRNTHSIQQAIIKSIDSTNEERDNMGENNLLIALESFEKNKIVNSYLDLFYG